MLHISMPSCLSSPSCILSVGRSYSHTWIVTHYSGGYLAGYIRVIEGHPWYQLRTFTKDVFIEQHFGIDWCGYDAHEDPDIASGWWIGFDCAKECDYPDERIVKQFGLEIELPYRKSWQQVRTIDYVERLLINFSQEAEAAIIVQNQQRKRK